MNKNLERFSLRRTFGSLLAAGGLALLLLLGISAPASAQDYPTPPPSEPAPQVETTELARTGSDNTGTLVLLGGGAVVLGGGLVFVAKRANRRPEPVT